MKRPRIIMAGVALAALAAAGGITAASAGGSNPTKAASAAAANAASANAASATTGSATTGQATVRTASVTVAGTTETILVNSQGLPLYIYRPDTATRSFVTGGLAQVWPPLTSAAVAGAGVTGKVAVLMDVNGHQVTYNGHPLYTFADDHADQVTGQGVQNFFVATPSITSITKSARSTAPITQAGPAGGYGY
jgi:predicted lipoprotein with Yx(FWY)xxD motif